ncbi:uncharacterized protein LOC135480471 [Liolophura sinensis]|uniref:uncharacterized protein LOC135480471 n=1 Tax=Liolophura sinensis TaxID=3198878 RepID=UPI0031592342
MSRVPGTNQSGKDGVAGLPVNFQVTKSVQRYATSDTIKLEDKTPYCSVCEEENQGKAVKFCSTCTLLYCKDCLASLHPMRGGLARHCLISAQEYLSQKTSDSYLECGRHGQPLSIYCVTCQDVICLGCLGEHPLHQTRDIRSATEEDKAMVMAKSGQMKEPIGALGQILSDLKGLRNNIQRNQDLHLNDIENAYGKALDVLKKWKENSIEAVKSRHTEWSMQCSAAVKHLEMQMEEMKRVQQSSKDLPSLMPVQILKGSKQLSKRIDDQLADIKTLMKKQEELKDTLTTSVNCYPVEPRHVVVTEEDVEQRIMGRLNIAKPNLVFKKTDGSPLRIACSGSLVECGDLTSEGVRTAVTDGRYRMGRYYLEVEITVLSTAGIFGCYCRVGVAQKGGDVKNSNPGGDIWYIKMQYSAGKVRCSSDCGGEMKPEFVQWRPHTGPQHIGLYIDCEDRSLTILDPDSDRLIYTVSGIHLTNPFVPFVKFSGVKSASALLVTGNSVRLPAALHAVLNNP